MEIKNLRSPMNGGTLKPTNKENFFKCDYDDAIYYLNKQTGEILTLKSPFSGGTLIFTNEENIFEDKYTGQLFFLNTQSSLIIPMFIPDESQEPAKIENNYLVGKISGRKYEIDSKGTILTPQEIYFQQIQTEDSICFMEMQNNGSIYKYLENTKNNSSKSNNSKKEPFIFKLKLYDKDFIDSLSIEELDSILNMFRVKMFINENNGHTFMDPIIGSILNNRYLKLTGKNHPNFLREIPFVLYIYSKYQSEIEKINKSIFNQKYFQEIEELKKKYDIKNKEDFLNKLISKIKKIAEENGLSISKYYFECLLLGQNNVIILTPERIKYLCDLAFGTDAPTNKLIYEGLLNKYGLNEEITNNKTI